jgi:hypothetical protein
MAESQMERSNFMRALAKVELDTAEPVVLGALGEAGLPYCSRCANMDAVEIVIARDAGKVLARMQPAKAKDIREAIDKVGANRPKQQSARTQRCAERVSHSGR